MSRNASTGPPLPLGLDLQPFVAAVCGELEVGGGAVFGPVRAGRQRRPKAGLSGDVVIPQLGTVQRDAPNADAGVLVLLLRVQQPVLAPVGGRLQKHRGLLQAHFGEGEVALQQLRDVNGHLDAGGRHHVLFLGPGRVGKGQRGAMKANLWPAELHRQVAVDGQFPPGLLQHHALQRGAQPVPAEDGNEHGGQHQRGQQGRGQAQQKTHQGREKGGGRAHGGLA
ncbi:MAG: hypothetical protein IPG16_17300 [Comamonadaceae bacterium]|nr:hypothetical protein [Comamonadaceae bacterium]